jgi:hypothetical protein
MHCIGVRSCMSTSNGRSPERRGFCELGMELDPNILIITACKIWCRNTSQLVQYGDFSENRIKVPIGEIENLKKLVTDRQNMLSITTFCFISRKIDSN